MGVKYTKGGKSLIEWDVEVVRRDLWLACRKYEHAFIRGCGRETLSYWVRDTVGRQYHPDQLRRVLEAHPSFVTVKLSGYPTRFYPDYFVKESYVFKT